jgi:hypothetical protein
MNISHPFTQLNKDLEHAKAVVAIIARLTDHAMKELDAWLDADDRATSYEYESLVMALHADKIRDHSVALADRIANLGKPSNGRVLLTSGGVRILAPEQISETKDAYDVAKLNKLDERDIRDAIEFNTELKDMFGLGWIDEEIGVPLRDALHLLCELLEDGVAIVPGTVVRVMKILLKGHRRGFSKYYTGTDPWPRPSAEVQAEIDARMPDALDWLRYELEEALEEEAEKSARDGLDSDRTSPSAPDPCSQQDTEIAANSDADMPFPTRLLQGGDIDESLFNDDGRRIDMDEGFFDDRVMTKQSYLPIEADEDLRKRIEADLNIDPVHLETLEDLKRLLDSDAEKDRVFCGSLDSTAKEVLDLLLEVAIREVEGGFSTVVGVVNKLILGALDIRVAERRNMLHQLIL